jgi:hypothetical protein
MNPQRWQQIDKLLEEVLDRPREQRTAFLDEACRGDVSLREEVVALLAPALVCSTRPETPGFIETWC